MNYSLTRPDPIFGAGSGLVRHELFQVAYATSDMDRACAFFAQSFGVKEFRRLEGPTAEGGHVRMEIGWAGAMMYELVCATGPGAEVFTSVLPAEGFATRLHHLGYFVPNTEAWEAVRAELVRSGRKIARDTNIPGFLKAVIVEAPELGHYLEYILPEAGGLAFFEGAPNN